MDTFFTKKPELYLDDINYHLMTIKNGNIQLQQNCNRDRYIYAHCEKIDKKLNIIINLINSTNLSIPIKIATKTNQLFQQDENLSVVNIQFINTKRPYNPTGIAFLKLEL